MALLPLDTLLKPTTEAEVKASLYDLADALGLKTTSWVSGAPTRILFAVVAKLFAGWDSLRVTITKAGFLDDAEGSWLKLLAVVVYGVEPVEATFASGSGVFVNAGGGVYAFDAGDVVVRNPSTGKTYRTTEAFTLGALETSAPIGIRATEAGTDSNAATGAISELETTADGVTFANDVDLIAIDAETEPDLRQRCRDSLGALSPNGPRAAYDYVARTPSLNGGITITRTKHVPPNGDGIVTLAIAGPAGTVDAPSVALVQAGIDEHATPEVVTATVVSATAQPLVETWTVWVAAGLLIDTEWETLLSSKLRTVYVPSIPIGGVELPPDPGAVLWRQTLGYLESLAGVIQARRTPEADVVLDPYEVATLAPGDVSLTIVQVA